MNLPEHLRAYINKKAVLGYDGVVVVRMECKIFETSPYISYKPYAEPYWELILPLVSQHKKGRGWQLVTTLYPMTFTDMSFAGVIQQADDFLREMEEEGYSVD